MCMYIKCIIYTLDYIYYFRKKSIYVLLYINKYSYVLKILKYL